MNRHPNQDLYEAYDENWQRIFFDKQNGGYVVAHNSHGKFELAQNTAVAIRLAKRGERVELLPDMPDQKTPDARRDGEVWEFKETNGSYTSVQRRLRTAKLQASKILLVLPEIFEAHIVLRALISSINNDNKIIIEVIDLLLANDALVSLTREDIRLRRFTVFWDALA